MSEPLASWASRIELDIQHGSHYDHGSSYEQQRPSLQLLCSFWKYVSGESLDRSDVDKYLEIFYLLQLRPLLQKVCLLLQLVTMAAALQLPGIPLTAALPTTFRRCKP